MRGKWSVAAGAAIGFVVLGCYIVAKDAYDLGWANLTWPYIVGTWLGAGVPGAVVGALICVGRNRVATGTRRKIP